jgi:outer membrane protein assembly factor BamB
LVDLIRTVAGLVCLIASRPAGILDWPQWLGSDREGVWRETDLIEKFPKEGPKIRWRVPIGNGYSGPAVVGDRVYVMDRQKRPSEAPKPAAAGTKPPASRGKVIPGNERVLCLDANDGSIVWKHEYDCPYSISYSNGPRTTPLVRDGRVYALGAMGDLTVLDAANGHVRWTKNLAKAFHAKVPFWGYAGHPLLEGDLLYCIVGGRGSAVVALNKDTGSEVWKSLDTQETGYSPPMLYEFGGRKQLIVWLSEAIYGVDPLTGKPLWKQVYPVDVPVTRPSVNIVTAKKVDDLLFISTFYHGPMMIKVDGDKADVLWRGKSNNPGKPDGAHCLMASPVFKDGYGYAMGPAGDLHCFDVKTGHNVWETHDALKGRKTDCGTVFLVPHEDHFVLFNDQGDLILADLTPKGYHEISRAHILEPNGYARGRNIVWSHPAFSNRCVFARNEKEMVCVSLAKP